MEYIKVTDALRCLSDALDNRKEYLGNFLDQYGLFNLTVYVSKDDGKSLEKDAVETKLLHDWIRTRYPVQSLMQTKFVSPYHLPKVQQAIINAMNSDEFSTEYQHYWEKDKFYSNRIFDLINNKPEIVGYQFGMNTDEITASTIQNLNDQLKNQADEIATLQARITQLESELNQQANAAPAIKHTNTALQALHDTIATHWQDYDPSQPRTRPKQEFIKAWILENYPEIEPSKALWIDRIIRHGTHN